MNAAAYREYGFVLTMPAGEDVGHFMVSTQMDEGETSVDLGMLLSPIGDAGPRMDAVVTKLTRAIDLGVLADGERLPSEIELSNHLGISTITLREGLSVLRGQGMIETRRGRGGGSFIRADLNETMLRARKELEELTTQEIRELGDEQFAILGAAAYLAAKRASPAEATRLREYVDAIDETQGLLKLRLLDSKFQILIAQLSQSSRLTHAEIRMQALFAPLMWQPGVSLTISEIRNQHFRIADAIALENTNAARDAAEQLVLENVRRLIKARLTGQPQ